MAKKIDKMRAAMILAHATMRGDPATLEYWGITQQTLRQYRDLIGKDAELTQLYHRHLEDLANDWRASINRALSKSIAFIDRASEKADPADPAVIEAMTKAIAVLGEISIAIEALGLARITAHESSPALPSPPSAEVIEGNIPEDRVDQADETDEEALPEESSDDEPADGATEE